MQSRLSFNPIQNSPSEDATEISPPPSVSADTQTYYPSFSSAPTSVSLDLTPFTSDERDFLNQGRDDGK